MNENSPTVVPPAQSAQETFNIVYRHLLTQNARAITSQYKCMYRTASGLKCAAGVLITDDVYNPNCEGKNCTVGEVVIMLEKSGVASDSIKLVRRLQNIHDHKMPAVWPEELKNLAEEWKLTIPSLS